MAHFAELDANNVVLRLIVVRNQDILDENGNESEQVGINYCKSLYGEETNWIQTSYNANFRKHYAAEGFVYDAQLDAFIPPKPMKNGVVCESWVLDPVAVKWVPPLPHPNDDTYVYEWNESTVQWEPDTTKPSPPSGPNANTQYHYTWSYLRQDFVVDKGKPRANTA